MSEEAVAWLALKTVTEIHINTNKNRLVSEVYDWLTKSKKDQYKGFEPQLFLHKSYFTVIPKHKKLLAR